MSTSKKPATSLTAAKPRREFAQHMRAAAALIERGNARKAIEVARASVNVLEQHLDRDDEAKRAEFIDILVAIQHENPEALADLKRYANGLVGKAVRK